MRPEAQLWADHVRPNLQHFGRLKRIEDLIEQGTSDVIYCLKWLAEPARMGWIELKRLRQWPARVTTRIQLPHFTDDQVAFLEGWGRAEAGAFLLAQVADDFLLFHWQQVKRVQGGLLASEMEDLAVAFGRDRFPTRDVLRCLTKI